MEERRLRSLKSRRKYAVISTLVPIVMNDQRSKEKEILFPGSYDNVKINESTEAFRLIDDQCSWATINLTTTTRYLKRIYPQVRVAAEAGHGALSAAHAKNTTWNGGNRPSIQLPTPSPIISKRGFSNLVVVTRMLKVVETHSETDESK